MKGLLEPQANDQTLNPIVLYLQSISKKASFFIALIGLVVVLGWVFDITALKSIVPGLVSMKANTAICFILGGLSLRLSHKQSLVINTESIKRKGFVSNLLFYLLPNLVILISLLTLLQYIFNIDFGIDQLFFRESLNSVATSAPGRMAPNTALAFLLVGSALLLINLPYPNYLPAQLFTVGVFLISFLGLLGYIYGNAYFYHFSKSYTGMALHTALTFILLGLGILFARPDRGLMGVVASNNAGGILARRLFPAAIVLPPLIGWLVLLGYRREVYTSDMGISLLGILNVIVFCILIWWNAKALNAIDWQRYQAEVALKKANDKLERRVLARTMQLQEANEQLQSEVSDRIAAEVALRESKETYRHQAEKLKELLHELQITQSQLIQTEKMSSLGQLVAGVAHEINNPINFIYGNITHASEYIENLIHLLSLYQQHYPDSVAEIQVEIEAIELDFLLEDLPKLLSSMSLGADRIREIVLSLRNFSRLDESLMKAVDIHHGIDSTLLILQHRFKAKPDFPRIELIKEYRNLPEVECYASQINQVFMNILSNSIDALEMSPRDLRSSFTPTISIYTELINENLVAIRIVDNGIGMTEEVSRKLFDPFFTTKPVGKGTGLGLSISYEIVVEKHGGQLKCISAPNEGTEFTIEVPIRQ